MPKSIKFSLYLAAALLLMVIIYFVVKGMSTSTTNNNPSGNNTGQNGQQNLPDYVLPASEEAKVKEFVKNFINLYNTYRYQDFTNLTALGDYQTASFQQKTVDLAAQLQQITPIGFNQVTLADPDSFKYSYPKASLLEVTMEANVTETVGGGEQSNFSPRSAPATNSYKIEAQVELTPSGSNWLVNDFKIQKLK